MKTVSGNFLKMPATRSGWWAGGLAVVFIVMLILILTELMRLPGMLTMVLGFVAGLIGLIAVVRQHERSWFTWLAVVCGLGVVLTTLGEILLPH